MQPIVRLVGILWLLLFLPLTVQAREWYVQPNAKLQTEYDDNIRLSTIDAQAAYGFIASMQTVTGMRNEISETTLSGGVDVYQYWGQNNLDRENFNLGLDTRLDLSERQQVRLKTSFVSDTSLTSELLTTGFLTEATKQIGREQVRVTPTWRYLLTETQSLKLDYTHEDVSYDPNANFLYDYQTDSASLRYIEQWSAAIQYYASFTGMRYELPDIGIVIDNYSLNFGGSYQYSPTLSFNAMVGARFTDESGIFNQAGARDSSSSVGALYSVGMEQQFERGKFKFNYSRDTAPTGRGALLQIDSLNADAEYQLTEQFVVMLTGIANFNSATGPDNSLNRDFYMLEPKLSWTASPQFSVVGGYRYRAQKFEQPEASANSNTVFLYLNYQWDKFASNAF